MPRLRPSLRKDAEQSFDENAAAKKLIEFKAFAPEFFTPVGDVVVGLGDGEQVGRPCWEICMLISSYHLLR